MARHDAGWWAERVSELDEGADPGLIARRYGTSVQLLKWWRWKLGRAAPKSVERRARTVRVQRLLPIVVAPAAESLALPADARDLEVTTVIETTRGRVSMRGTLSPEQLAAVVAELVRGC